MKTNEDLNLLRVVDPLDDEDRHHADRRRRFLRAAHAALAEAVHDPLQELAATALVQPAAQPLLLFPQESWQRAKWVDYVML